MLSNRQFERTRRLASDLAGIELAERHRELLGRRSRRLGVPDGGGLDSLLDAVEEGQGPARQKFLCLLTTKFTRFFRHPRQFHLAAEHALRVARRQGRVRLWSAAAATGEEPYSLAMALIEAFDREDPPAAILGTDVDVEALAAARQGQYAETAVQGLEPERRRRFLSEVGQPRCWAIAPAVRRLVEFRLLNLADVAWPVEGPFDVILCRNVLMYLEGCHRYAVLEHMASLLAPHGLLILDPAEHLGKAGHLFAPGTDGVYSRPRESCPRRGVAHVSSIPSR
jgi:chemotaxis protein methyltransferase CheR